MTEKVSVRDVRPRERRWSLKSVQAERADELLFPLESDREPRGEAMNAKPAFTVGNAVVDGRRGWFIGQFFPAESGMSSQSTLEVKWGQHPKGDRRAGFAASRFGGTISLLISGRFLLKMIVDGETREILLSTPGDYTAFAAGIPHSWEALEESLVISIRFPSIEGNQIELPAAD